MTSVSHKETSEDDVNGFADYNLDYDQVIPSGDL